MVDFQDWEVGSQKRTGTEFFVADKFEILDSMLPSADKIKPSMFYGMPKAVTNICWIIKKGREFHKNIYFCFIDYAKALDCVDHNKLKKILKKMGIPDHLTTLLRNLYADQEATVRTGHGTTDCFQIGKGVRQGCILSPCLFNLYASTS